MPIQNADIAQTLEQLADLLEIQGENPFRVRAYQNAARIISEMPKSLSAMLNEGIALDTIPGIGSSIADKVKEMVDTGHLSALESVQHQMPGHLSELMKIPGLGPRRIKLLHEALGIQSLHDLDQAIQAHKLRDLHGFNIKTEERLGEEIAKKTGQIKRLNLYKAEPIAEPLVHYLQAAPGVQHVVIAGSYRRRRETVGDLDILVTGGNHQAVMERFVTYKEVERILSQGSTRAAVILRGGLQVDLRFVPPESYGAALLYFTGSKSHNIVLRTYATRQGLKMNEYGVFEGENRIAGQTEAEIYQLLGCDYIEPELRENHGEVEAARQGQLPRLITQEQIKGDLHAHTEASDGKNTIEEMAQAANAKGYDYLAITDHTKHTRVAHGLDETRMLAHLDAIDRVNDVMDGLTLLKSAEVDILKDGSLDLPNSILKKMDVVICSVHYLFELDSQKQTERVLRALDNPYVNVLCHPTGRLINKRKPYEINLEKVMQAALERGCCLELNAQPMRLDLSDHYCRMAKEMGLKMVISTDSHKVSDLNNMRYGVEQARRAWLEADNIANTRDWRHLQRLFKR